MPRCRGGTAQSQALQSGNDGNIKGGRLAPFPGGEVDVGWAAGGSRDQGRDLPPGR